MGATCINIHAFPDWPNAPYIVSVWRVDDLELRAQGSRAKGSGFRVQDLGFRVQGLRVKSKRKPGLGFKGLGFRV